MPSSLVTRSIKIGDSQVAVCIERLFWISLDEIANAQATTTSKLLASIDRERAGADLPSIIRSYVLDHFQQQCRRLDDSADEPPWGAERPALALGPSRPRWLN